MDIQSGDKEILRISGLTKHFGTNTALDSLDLTVDAGSVFGLLGPNGAGKTTLLRIINRILNPDAGTILLSGQPLSYATAPLLGYMPEERGLYSKMRVRDQIMFFGRLRGGDIKRMAKVADEYMELFEIPDFGRRKVEELSKGNQQKVQIISTLVHEPKLLILDEPFSGFDPLNSRLLAQLIEKLRSKGTTVMLSSHNMAAVEEMCESIALINKGHIILSGRLDDIKESHRDGSLIVTTRNQLSINMLTDQSSVVNAQPVQGLAHRKGFSYRIEKSADASNVDVLTAVAMQGEITHFEEALPSLSDIFISYTSSQHE